MLGAIGAAEKAASRIIMRCVATPASDLSREKDLVSRENDLVSRENDLGTVISPLAGFCDDRTTLAFAQSCKNSYRDIQQCRDLNLFSKYQCTYTLRGHKAAVSSATPYQIGEDHFILTASVDTTAKVWKKNGDAYTEITTLSGHTGPVVSATPYQIGGQHFILTASDDNTAKVWEMFQLSPLT